MIYTTLKFPVALIDIANAVARAIDPDTGGDKTFVLPPTKNAQGKAIPVPTEITKALPFFDSFAPQVEYMLGNADALYAFVSADYATRWPDLTPPTKAEVQAFCAGVVIVKPEPVVMP